MSKAILIFNAYETLKELYNTEVVITISYPVKSEYGLKGYQYHSTEYAILKPMPEKVPEAFMDFDKGFNYCIDEILRGKKT